MKYIYSFILLLSIQTQAQVSPLLSTTWNQTCYYNALMPTVSSGGSCGKAYTGCNATAMAQICKYYAYPNSGFGNHCNSLSPSNCVDYDLANYNYASMPNNVTSANSDVATLMYDLGVAVDMNWNGTNSTSFFSGTVLKKHFAYSPKMYAVATFLFPSTGDLIEGIKAELDNGRPVFAKGGGHFYLIDGYDLSDNFHMNFGWSGTYNSYYPIDGVVTPAGTFTPSNFIFGIEPMVGELETAKDTIFISASGVSSENIEFTSLLDWTMTTSDPWISLNTTAGTKGFYTFSDGSTFAAELNNGIERTGYILVQNANEIDTIVVVQATSPMSLSPNPLNFSYTGGTSSVSITHDMWVTWNVVESEAWLSISQNSGTGNGSFDVTSTGNSGGAFRAGYAVVTGGGFTDTVFVTQEADPTLSMNEEEKKNIYLYPNPTTTQIVIEGLKPDAELELIDLLGNQCKISPEWNGTQFIIDLSNQSSGIYVVVMENERLRIVKK